MKKLILITVLCLFTLQCEQGWLKDILVPPVEGCTDSSSCNYNSDAEEDDGNCIAKQGCNGWCESDDGSALELDCAGNCGGPNWINNCGDCTLGNPELDDTQFDNCGICDNNLPPKEPGVNLAERSSNVHPIFLRNNCYFREI